MNIISKLTLRHLKENKGRTVVTTLGICVSVAMITAVFVALASFLNLFGEIELISSGKYHASLDVNREQLEALENDDRIETIGIEYYSGDSSFRLLQRKSDHSGTGDFVCGNNIFVEQKVTGSYEGTLPKNKNEIAIEQSLINKNNLDWKIGDTVTISTGTRSMIDNGIVYTTDGVYNKGETFEGTDIEYKITAILHDNPTTNNNQIILCTLNENEAPDFTNTVSAKILLKKINHNSINVIKDIIKSCNIEGYDINTDYLCMYFAFDKSNTLVASLLSITMIVLLIIMSASVVLIYNAFAMSINERIRYLGMLASVGATKKQKKLSVYFESLILGIIGIPVGIAGGILGISITLKLIGRKIISSGMILGISASNMEMNVVTPVWAIIGIVFFSAFTIFISSFIPSRKASKITPIDAIKQTNEIKIKSKKLRSSKLVRLIFGYEGEIANKNLKRNGKKAKVITASIALSVILFLCCNYFCDLFSRAAGSQSEMPYQVTTYIKYVEKDDLIEFLSENDKIDDFYCISNAYVQIDGENSEMFDIAQQENLTLTYKNLFSKGTAIYINIIDDDMFNDLCKANGIDENEYYGETPKTLLMNNVSHKNGGSKVFTNKVLGSDFIGLVSDAFDNMTVGALIDYDENSIACNLNPQNTISFYIPLSVHKTVLENFYLNAEYGYQDFEYRILIGINTSLHSEVTDEINEFIDGSDISSCYVSDCIENMQAMITISFVLQVLIYGFIALITLITVFNIINTISTGVAMRKKEFAMLKSVGMTPKGFNKMIMLESAFYGIKAILIALPTSALISYIMYVALDSSGVIPFEINIPLYLAITAVVIVIICATMFYSVHKLRNDSIVETLKQEIN